MALKGASPAATPCPFDGDRRPHAPRVLALDTRLPHAATPAQERDHARALARAALTRALAVHLGCAPQALSVSEVRGTPPRLAWAAGDAAALDAIGLSISHAPGLSLAAWSPQGAVGVDVQAVPRTAGRAELWRTAALFFGKNQLETLDRQASTAPFFEVFAHHWAAHEAALKCARLALAEYSPAVATRLAGMRVVTLGLPAWASAGVVAALAYRPLGDSTPR